MKLETKHIAAYLPYKLKVRVEDYKCDYVNREFDEVIGLHQWDKSGLLWSALTDGGAKPSLDRIKPVFYPLSCLTKYREDLGFVPNEWFEIGDDDNNEEYYHGNIKLIKTLERISEFKISNDIDYLPFGVVQKLLEWHFDIYGLIENNLAIDINTLNK